MADTTSTDVKISMLSQDDCKIIQQILLALRYLPPEAKLINGILEKLDNAIVDKTIDIPNVSISPENINIKIELKSK